MDRPSPFLSYRQSMVELLEQTFGVNLSLKSLLLKTSRMGQIWHYNIIRSDAVRGSHQLH